LKGPPAAACDAVLEEISSMKRIAFALAALALIVAPLPTHLLFHASAQSGNSYTNATWGYSVTWDESVWFAIAQDDPTQNTDLLLSNGISYVSFAADDTIPAPPLCVTLYENGLTSQTEVSNIQDVNGPDGQPIRSTDADRSFVAKSFTVVSQGQTLEVTEYFECRTLVPFQAVLIIDHFVIPGDAYATEAPLVEALLTGVTIPDNAGQTNQGDQTPTPAATEESTPTEEPTAAPTEGTSQAQGTTRNGEPGPVFVSGAWRVSVVAGVRSPGLNAIGLKRKTGKDWVVLVADVTNWTNASATLNLRDIQLTFPESTKAVRAAPSSSGTAAKALRVSITDISKVQSFRANQTRRTVLAYSVDQDFTDAAISFGTTLPIADLFAQEVDLENLPSVIRPQKLIQAEVDQVRDGGSLDLFLPDDDSNLTVSLASIAAPVDNDCFANEAADRLNELAGSTVFLESTGDDASSPDARYVWAEAEDGTRTLINHEMLAGGFAIFQESSSTRFAAWLQGAEQEAKDQEAGLWKECANELPSATVEATATATATPTEVPPTPTEIPTSTATPRATATATISPTATATIAESTASPSASASATTSASTDEPTSAMFRGGPTHSGVQPGPGLTAPAKLPWEFRTASSIFSSPAIVDGVIYVGSLDGSVYALNSSSGPALWQFTTGAGILSSPAVADGVVYIGSQDTNLYAIDAASGRERWRFATGSEVLSSPAVVDGIVYVGGMDSYAYAIDAKTGEEIWKVRVGQAFSSPAVVDGVVYIGGGPTLYALDAKSGETKWSAPTGGPVESSPAVVNGAVFVGNDSGTVLAVDRETGNELWRFAAGDAVISSPSVADGTVYFGSADKSVYALDATTGKVVWTYLTGDQITSSPAVADGVVYIGSFDGYIYGLDGATGAERWRYQASPIFSSPAVAGDIVYFGTGDGRLLARKPFNLLNIGV
jgi:outer membrane protein assembly factor BamB/endonuclease YncB( thermonuclease family)